MMNIYNGTPVHIIGTYENIILSVHSAPKMYRIPEPADAKVKRHFTHSVYTASYYIIYIVLQFTQISAGSVEIYMIKYFYYIT